MRVRGIERFATSSVARDERLDFWNCLAAETYQGLTVDADRAIDAAMLRWSLDEIVMLRPRSQASVVRRWATSSAARTDRLILHMLHRGRMRNTQHGQEAELMPSDFVLCSADDPYRVDVSDAHETLVVELPRAPLVERIGDLTPLIARRIPGTATGSRLLHDFLLALWQQGDQSEADSEFQRGVANVLMDLIAVALRGAGRPTQADAHGLPGRLQRLIEARLSDPALGTSSLADELGVSVRSVQNAFAGLTTTPSAYILERRLLRAGERLAAEPRMPITALAFELGFNDSAYFARVFRHRFGMSPREWRGRS